MAVSKVDIDEEAQYMDRLLAAWSRWAWHNNSKLGFPAAGVIWGVKTPKENRRTHELVASDDQFTLLDRKIATLNWPQRKLIFVEYWMDEPKDNRAKRFHIGRKEYERRLLDLWTMLYNALMPDVEDWRLAVL